MNKRLLFILSGICLLFLAPGLAHARVIGVIMPAANIPYFVAIQQGFEAELKRQGVEVVPLEVKKPAPDETTGWLGFARRNAPRSGTDKEEKGTAGHQGKQVLEIAVQRPAPNDMSRKNSARTLMALDATLILAYGAGPAMAALSETNDLPIVYCGAFDPAGMGATGKNVTGVGANVPLKVLVNHLRKMTNFTKLGVLFSSDEADSVRQVEAVTALGVQVVKIDAVQGVDSIALPADIQAVLLTCAGAVQNQKAIEKIVGKARTAKIGTASVLGGSADLGVILSMAANAEQQAQEAAKLVTAILKGDSPSSLPAVAGDKIELAVNLAGANALGLNIPFELIATAKVVK